MKLLAAIALTTALAAATPVDLEKRANPAGIDVSHYQGTINWATAKANGVAFAFIKVPFHPASPLSRRIQLTTMV